MKSCECGCGDPAPIASHTHRARGYVAGKPMRFIVGHNTRRPVADRIWEKVERGGPDDCWPFRGGGGRYGTISVGGRDGSNRLVHRVVYELEVGPIPAGLTIDHTCRNTRCVNPAHLEAVTHHENTRRSGRWELKPHCKRGHTYDAENTYVSPGGQRKCRACKRFRDAGYREAVAA